MRSFSSMWDMEFKLVQKKYKQSLEELKKGTCDIIMADVAIAKRKEQFKLRSRIYLPLGLMSRESDTPWVSDFPYLLAKNHKIGVEIELSCCGHC